MTCQGLGRRDGLACCSHRDWQSDVTLGSSDDEGFADCMPGCDLSALCPGGSWGDVAHQGSHQYRRRAAENQLIGYGLVVGLDGTGDTLNNIPFTKQSLTAMLERLGVNIRGQTIRTGNVAAVMVTANLPAFGTQGTRIDVTVSAMRQFQEPARRNAAGDATPRRRWQRVRRCARIAGDRRLSGRRRGSHHHPWRADRRPDR